VANKNNNHNLYYLTGILFVAFWLAIATSCADDQKIAGETRMPFEPLPQSDTTKGNETKAPNQPKEDSDSDSDSKEKPCSVCKSKCKLKHKHVNSCGEDRD